MDISIRIQEDPVVHNGVTFINVSERNELGELICSGCKQAFADPIRAYAQTLQVDDKTKKVYAVHKLCMVKKPEPECFCGRSVFLDSMCAVCLKVAKSHHERHAAEIETKLDRLNESLMEIDSSLEMIEFYLERVEDMTEEDWNAIQSAKYGPNWREVLNCSQ